MDRKRRNIVEPPPPLLSSIPAAAVHEFAKVAVVSLVKNESGTKGFTRAARHLHTTVEAVAQSVSVISTIYAKAARGNLSHQQLVDFLSIHGYGENLRQALADSFVDRVAEIREVISVSILQLPSYCGLDWRLDVQVASRSLRNQSVPSFLIKLRTRPARLRPREEEDSTGQQQHQQMQTDVRYLEATYVTLKTLCSHLELALSGARTSAHGFRVMRLLE